ncbi:MAG: glycosyltransferase family 9 protein [Ignavibacteriales bacterium]|nr:glycosyltransferase family 9 protein [Ignavibacteriales bacterium]
MNKPKRILIIRLSSLGDILLSTPLVRSLKNQWNTEIDFLLRMEYRDVYSNSPHISDLFLYENQNDERLVKELKSKKYDLIIDLQNNLRSNKIVRTLGIESVRFHKKTIDKFLLVKFKINRMTDLPPIPIRYANTVSQFELDDLGLEIFLPNNLPQKIRKKDNYIGLCPGSKHFTKMWPAEYFIQLGIALSKNGYKIALFGGKDDKVICEKIAKKIPSSINLSNENHLLQTATEMKNCKAVICNDSGLTHLACALKVPVVMIMGSTVKEFGFIPYKNKNLILENNSLSCRPCSHIGRKDCPKKHFKCMIDLTPEYTLKMINDFLITI